MKHGKGMKKTRPDHPYWRCLKTACEFARHRNGLKEARDAIVASRAARAALRIADSESDMSSDDDMEGNSGDENTEFEEFVDEIMSDYQPELDEEEDFSDSE